MRPRGTNVSATHTQYAADLRFELWIRIKEKREELPHLFSAVSLFLKALDH